MTSPVGMPAVNNASPNTLAQNTSTLDYKSQFLQLLMVQLKNQDPTQPFDSQKMLADQAQFASLEQMQNLNTNFVTLMAMQNVSQGTNLIGKNVVATDSTGASVSGLVTGIKFAGGTAMLSVQVTPSSTVEVKLPDVTEVTL
jgi:flagellar basal-body rod modification protein FlgD